MDASPHLPQQLELLRSVVSRALPGPLPSSIFLTHCHWGHYAGLGWLGKESADARGLPLYLTPDQAGFLRENRPWRDLLERGNLALRLLVGETPVPVEDSISITPRWVNHRRDAADTVAYQVDFRDLSQRVLYMPDVDSLDPLALDLIASSQVAVIDGTFYRPGELKSRGRRAQEVPHPFISRDLDRLEELLGRTRIVFTHFNHTNPAGDEGSPEARALVDRGFQLAADGMVVAGFGGSARP